MSSSWESDRKQIDKTLLTCVRVKRARWPKEKMSLQVLQSTSPVFEAGVHAHIISAGLQDTVKQLGNVLTQHNCTESFLSFIRLVGIAYFIKNCSAFTNFTPAIYFDSFIDESENDPASHHYRWYNGKNLGENCIRRPLTPYS